MLCRAVAASLIVTGQFLEVVENATREGFIFFLAWYRVVLGVQFKYTSGKGVRGFRGGIGEEGLNLCSCLIDPEGPPARHRHAYSIVRLSRESLLEAS